MERLVEASVAILARASPIYEVIRQAAADPDVGVLLQENRRRRRDDQRRLIEVLGRSGHLRPGLDVDTAADVFYGLLNEEVFLLLTGGLRLGGRPVPGMGDLTHAAPAGGPGRQRHLTARSTARAKAALAPDPVGGTTGSGARTGFGRDYPRTLVSSTVVWSANVRTAKVSATW